MKCGETNKIKKHTINVNVQSTNPANKSTKFNLHRLVISLSAVQSVSGVTPAVSTVCVTLAVSTKQKDYGTTGQPSSPYRHADLYSSSPSPVGYKHGLYRSGEG